MATEQKAQGAHSSGTKEQTSGMVEQAKETASEVGEQAREQVTSRLDEQKHRAAEQIGSMSSALRQTSETLREEEDNETIAGYMESAARQVDRFSDYLRRRSVREIYDEAEGYARREPSLFIGGALLAGFLGARFLRSSESNRRRREQTPRRHTGRVVGGAERHQRHPARPGMQEGQQGYSEVHGTAGAEMPEPGREQSSSPSSTSGSTTPSTRGAERETRH